MKRLSGRSSLSRWGAGVAASLILLWWIAFPIRFRSPYSAVLYSHDGELLGAKISADGQWRFPPLEKIPPRYKAALLCQEDKRFAYHPGVDPLAIARALRLNARAHRVVSGGSTISMQVVRLARDHPPRTAVEKALEMLGAIRLEASHRKETILRLYAAHAPFGGNVVGLEAAAWRYFGRRPEDLSWAESSMLAVLPNSPSLVRPGKNRGRLRFKRDRLLRALARQGSLSPLDLKLALQEPLPLDPRPLPRLAPHLLETLQKRSRAGVPRFYSELDGSLQRAAMGIVARRSQDLARQGIGNAAVIVIDNRDFVVRAYVGNSRAEDQEEKGLAVDLIVRPRSTGSLLKPFLYAAMLESGDLLPSTLIPDIPSRFNGFTPENFDRGYRGAVPARVALARSLNIPAVRLLRQYGVARFHALLKNAGMTTLFRAPDDYGLTLCLGGAEGTLWDLSAMYANLARIASGPKLAFAGYYARPRLLKGDRGETARVTEIGPGAAWLTLQMLLEVRRPEEELYWERFASGKKIAWKTGTSFGQRDGWAVGVTPRWTVAVWTGNASGQGRAGLIGSATAGPILFDIFNRLKSEDWFAQPLFDLKSVEVCRDDGFLPAAGCATKIEWAPRASHFEEPSPFHRTVHLDAGGRWRVNGNCESVARMRHESWFVLPPSQEYYYRRHEPLYRPLPAYRADCREGEDEQARAPIEFLYPYAGSRIYIPVDLGMKREKTVFEAVHRRADAILYWHLDNHYLGTTQTFHQQALDMDPGEHQVTVVDQFGNRLSRRFEVLKKPAAAGPR